MDNTYLKGIERSKLWWMIDVAPAIEQRVPDLYPYIAAGLVGDGSDCFGFDDEISLDHDADTRVKLWIPMGVGGEGAEYRIRSAVGLSTKGVLSVEEIPQFYRRYTGLDFSPNTWHEWLAIPQKNLAAATNGEVFFDEPGRFSERRRVLLDYYPQDVCLKLLEGAVLRMGQAGQYNYPRCLRRNERVAAQLAKSIFIDAALNALFILNKRYMPFYKWAHRALTSLPILGEYASDLLDRIACTENATGEIEELSQAIINELHAQQLSSDDSDFLIPHARVLREQIIEPELREANPWKI
ncbi:MAG: DUF4037 domain-containing protein [Actinomycetaceae bacterium]|nr:DUF4037 domain-containing protein [Arcanobacterium sp.]MDD7686757.1 DUF4037 domain-containing protein [Actinomycetaceae bacterium]MDY5272565.1 DUF4037 domain-containing protein [Arcanobacterium sp.]